MNYLIGCGGVGSAIVPSFCLLKSPDQVTLIDGDTLEVKNLNRQMFDARQVGMNKAQALAAKYHCRFIPEWFARGKIRHQRNDWLICLVDNHRTRLEALEVCDESGCQAIFAANETHSSEAYHYRRTWKGTHRDPRVYYPEISSDRSGDPRAASIGCTGEAQANNRLGQPDGSGIGRASVRPLEHEGTAHGCGDRRGSPLQVRGEPQQT